MIPKEFYIYRQEFKFKVSYMIISPGLKSYIPNAYKKVGVCNFKSKPEAAKWLKWKLDRALK